MVSVEDGLSLHCSVRGKAIRPRFPTGSCVLSHRGLTVYEEVRGFSSFLRRHADEPVVVVTGDSSSALHVLYRQLPVILQLAGLTGDVRVVSHGLASKGLGYCTSPDCHISCAGTRACDGSGTSTQVSRSAHAQSRETLRSLSSSTELRTSGPVFWRVPRFLTHCHGLGELLTQWSVSPAYIGHAVQFIFFVNSDLADDILFDSGGCALVTGCANHARDSTSMEETCVLCPTLRSFAANVCVTPMTAKASRHTAERTEWPLFRLRSCCALWPSHKRRAFELLRNPRDLELVLSLLPRPSTPWPVSPQRNVSAPINGTESTPCLGRAFPLPHVYADAEAANNGARASCYRHHAESLMVEALRDTQEAARTLCTRDTPSAKQDPINATRFFYPRDRVLHTYFPVVCGVGDLLAKQCCLSDVFVFELQADVTETLQTEAYGAADQPQESRSPICAERDAALREATTAFVMSRRMEERHAVEKKLRELLEALCPSRKVLSWSASTAADRAPRVAACFSYEVYSEASMLSSLQEEKHLLKKSRDHEGITEIDLPTTLSFVLSRLFAFLRGRGWALVGQESHHTWDTARPLFGDSADANSSAVQGGAASGSPTLANRVISLAGNTNYEKQRYLYARRQRAQRGRPKPDGWGTDAWRPQSGLAERKRRLDGDFARPTGWTSAELWQAALVTEENGLTLWEGAKVGLPDGRCGVVVGFSKVPSWVSAAAHSSQPAQAPAHRLCTDEDSGRRVRGLRARHVDFCKWARAMHMNGRPRWKMCLPFYMSTMETALWPVVQLEGQPHSVLVLPTRTTRYEVNYPRVCLVTAGQQYIRAKRTGATGEMTAAAAAAGAAACTYQQPSQSSTAPPPAPGHYAFHDMWWSLSRHAWLSSAAEVPVESEDSSVSTVQLPLVVEFSESAASLYLAFVMSLDRDKALWALRILPPAAVPQKSGTMDTAVLTTQQGVQHRWQLLHQTRLQPSVHSMEMGHPAPAPVALAEVNRIIHAASFARRPCAMRAVIASVRALSCIRVDNPNMWVRARTKH